MSNITLTGYELLDDVGTVNDFDVAEYSTNGNLTKNVSYNYMMVYISPFGRTRTALNVSNTTTTGSMRIYNIPTPPNVHFIMRKIYRTSAGPAPPYKLIKVLKNPSETEFIDALDDNERIDEDFTIDIDSADPHQTVNGRLKSNNIIYSTGTDMSAFANPTDEGSRLSKQYNIITSVNEGDCVKLPDGIHVGTIIKIRNSGVFNLYVYPHPGQAINDMEINNSYELAINSTIEFIYDKTNHWTTI